MRPMRLMVAAAALAAFPGCGTASCAAGMCAAPVASPSLTATEHGWTTIAILKPAPGPILLTVRVTGPLQVEGGCVAALTAWLVTTEGRRLEASPTPGVRCQAIQVEDVSPARTAEFTIDIRRPPPGEYTIHGLLRTHLPMGAGARVSENLPVVSLTVP